MPLALGLTVHTGWAAAAVAGGGWAAPKVVARERLNLLGEDARFVFHKAAEMAKGDARDWVARAKREALEHASAGMKRAAATHGVKACAIVAKTGAQRPLDDIVAAHPRIHTAEGCFYRDVLEEAAVGAGMRVIVVAPSSLDAKDARLARVGEIVGKPWSVDWKLAVMAAWTVG